MRCSIELWLRFIVFSIRRIVGLGSPFTILQDDVVARELFNNHVKSSGKLLLNAFLASEKSGFGISLHRWSYAPRHLFEALGLSRTRPPLTFKGFALFTARDLSKISAQDGLPVVIHAEPTRQNAFHANIPLSPGREKSYYMFVASEFLAKIKPTTDLVPPRT